MPSFCSLSMEKTTSKKQGGLPVSDVDLIAQCTKAQTTRRTRVTCLVTYPTRRQLSYIPSTGCVRSWLNTIDREIFTLKIIRVKIFHVIKFSRFRSIREFFLTVDDCNMDKLLESSWRLSIYYQVSGEPWITGCSLRLLGECGPACKLIRWSSPCNFIFHVLNFRGWSRPRNYFNSEIFPIYRNEQNVTFTFSICLSCYAHTRLNNILLQETEWCGLLITSTCADQWLGRISCLCFYNSC